MKRLRLGAVLHFIIAIGHIGCLFALDEAFDAYGIKDVMHNIVFGLYFQDNEAYRYEATYCTLKANFFHFSLDSYPTACIIFAGR